MKDEIKEILDKLQKVANRETASRNALMEMKDKDYQLLLDYITNLEKENENRISESLSYDLAVARIKELERRNEKAIEYIKNENICREELPKYARIEINNFDKKYRNDLLNILQGSDEE